MEVMVAFATCCEDGVDAADCAMVLRYPLGVPPLKVAVLFATDLRDAATMAHHLLV